MTDIPALVLGGTGYVAGELLRLLAAHPDLQLAGVMSDSQAGTPVATVFPHLQHSVGKLRFSDREALLSMLNGERMALFSAAPHGASAALVARFIEQAEQTNTTLTVVDVSADFRYPSAAAYSAVYGTEHGAPQLLNDFASALPEHLATTDRAHIGHPGCFATALLMAALPLTKLQLVSGDLYASGITGSTGSGRTPVAGTHHPQRHSNLYAYKPLAHRHAPEVTGICAALTGHRPVLHFVPHSGPFARGIHMTMQGRLHAPQTSDELLGRLQSFYEGCEFVSVREGTPRIKDVVGSNYCHIGAVTDADSFTVMVVIDNLLKGAAGGAVQWMNRQLGLAETAGLETPALPWT